MLQKKIEIFTYVEVAIHGAFWLLLIFIGLNSEFTTNLEISDSLDPGRIHYRMPINMFVFYFNFFFLSTRLKSKALGVRLGSAFILIFLAAAFEAIVDGVQLLISAHANALVTIFGLFLINSVIQTMYWLLSVLFRRSHDIVVSNRLNRHLSEQNTQIELALLKTQLNPHFLFNVLNALYISSYEYGDASTASGINKLSKLLRYLLYETNDQLVSLESEIECLKNYNELQKMRFLDDVTVNMRIHGDYGSWKVAPFLFITLLENAYKHGIRPEHSCVIDVNLNITKDQLVFSVANDLVTTGSENGLSPEAGGLGLENLSRRLELLYPQRHVLLNFIEGMRYNTRLELR